MIKFIAEKLIGFGLSAGNIKLLREGRPIKIDMSSLGPLPKARLTDYTVVIFYGETEKEMTEELSKWFGPDTRVNIDDKLKDS